MEKFTMNLQIAPELHLSNSPKQEGVACETARMRIMHIFKILASENQRQLQVSNLDPRKRRMLKANFLVMGGAG